MIREVPHVCLTTNGNSILTSKEAILIFCFSLAPKWVKNLLINPIALRKARIVYNFGLSECNRVKEQLLSFKS